MTQPTLKFRYRTLCPCFTRLPSCLAVVLRSRLAMLSAAARAYQHAQTQLRFSCIMCVDVAGVKLVEAAAERCRSSSALFPEHR